MIFPRVANPFLKKLCFSRDIGEEDYYFIDSLFFVSLFWFLNNELILRFIEEFQSISMMGFVKYWT